jgi:hypothetical protein
MNIYRCSTFIIISFLFIACDSKYIGLNENFPRIINLTEYEIIVNDDKSMFLSSHIEIIDSIAIIQEHEGKYKFIFPYKTTCFAGGHVLRAMPIFAIWVNTRNLVM